MTKLFRMTGYGDTVDFSTLAKAQAAVRACGDDFAQVTLMVRGDRILDGDDIVGYVRDPAAMAAAASLGARGGRARAASLTPERRREIARLAGSQPKPSRRKVRTS